LHSRRAPGLRALRIQPDGLKPTSVFLVHLGDWITSSRIEVDRDALRRLASGQPLPSDREDGYVALSYRGDVIGCGQVRRGALRAVIPTGRRRELLEALAADSENL
jgi:NOL1/NOP2/fmu family ribosome biogenesis protein